MKKTPAHYSLAAVEDYFSAVPEPARATLLKVRAVIRSAVPAEATEGISYGIPMFKYKGVLLGLGAFKDHCSLFLGTSSLGDLLSKDLENYSVSKGTIRFPVDKPMPASLVKKIVKLRVQQNETKKPSKR